MTYSDEELRLLRKLREAVLYVSSDEECLAVRDTSDRQRCEMLRRKARGLLRGGLGIAVSFFLLAHAVGVDPEGMAYVAAGMAVVVATAAFNYLKLSALAKRVERVLEREARVAPPPSAA